MHHRHYHIERLNLKNLGGPSTLFAHLLGSYFAPEQTSFSKRVKVDVLVFTLVGVAFQHVCDVILLYIV